MIKVEPGSDSFTLLFRNKPVLKVSTQQPQAEAAADTADTTKLSPEEKPESCKNGNVHCHNFQLID